MYVVTIGRSTACDKYGSRKWNTLKMVSHKKPIQWALPSVISTNPSQIRSVGSNYQGNFSALSFRNTSADTFSPKLRWMGRITSTTPLRRLLNIRRRSNRNRRYSPRERGGTTVTQILRVLIFCVTLQTEIGMAMSLAHTHFIAASVVFEDWITYIICPPPSIGQTLDLQIWQVSSFSFDAFRRCVTFVPGWGGMLDLQDAPKIDGWLNEDEDYSV